MPLTVLRHAIQRPPPGPLKIDIGHPLAQGLMACVSFNDYGSATIWEPITGVTLPQIGSPTWGNGSGSGPAGFVTSATGARAEIALPTPLRINWPITIVWSGYKLGTTAANGVYFAATANNTFGSPFEAYGFIATGTGIPQLFYSWGAGLNAGQAAGAAPGAGPMWMAGTLAATGQTFYLNDPVVSVSTLNSTGGAAGVPNYSATSLLAFGGQTGNTANSNVVHLAAHVYNRILSNSELAWLKAEPYAMWQTRSVQRWFGGSTPPGLGPVVQMEQLFHLDASLMR